MRKTAAFLLCFLLLSAAVSGALAQSISCPDAHLVLTVPDTWISVPLTKADDPDLRLLLQSDDVTLSLYVSDAGGILPDAFQVFTGDETESGEIILGGMEMAYVFGENEGGEYRIYTWLDVRNQVQMYFLVTGHPKQSAKVIEEIMNTLVFE